MIIKKCLIDKCAIFLNDAFYEWQTYLQDPATLNSEGLFEFNQFLLLIVLGIIILIGWLLTVIILNYPNNVNSKKTFIFNTSTKLEVYWTILPILLLVQVMKPSFILLFSLDDVANPDLTLKIFGHQWYWSYEISDFNSCSKTKNLKFTSYIMDNAFMKKYSQAGFVRLIETNKRALLPTKTPLRLLITSFDVLHSWSVPSFGIKVDACPGRLNQIFIHIKRFGLFFGQCSELCGTNHAFMPIALIAVPSEIYYAVIVTNLKF